MDDEHSFSDSNPWRGSWQALTGIGLAIFVAFAIFYLSRPTTPARLEAEIALEGDLEAVAALKSEYPADYRHMLEVIAETQNSEGRAVAAREAFMFMRSFLLSKRELIVNASDADLHAMAEANLALATAIRDHDVGLCAQFIMVGFPRGAPMFRRLAPAFHRVTAVQIRAARNSERRPPAQRPELSEADASRWLERTARLAPDAAALILSDRLAQGTPRQQCDAGVALYQAAAEPPRDRAARITAHLTRMSFATLAGR